MNKQNLNDLAILSELKVACYTGNDVRASWIADYNMETDIIDRYKNNIVHSSFYDNTKLHTNDYIIDEPIETYEYTSSGIGGIEGAPK